MRRLKRHKQFVKDLKACRLTDTQFEKLALYATILVSGKALPSDAHDHRLEGEWKSFREFHLGGDILVIYVMGDEDVTLCRLGSHSQLFG